MVFQPRLRTAVSELVAEDCLQIFSGTKGPLRENVDVRCPVISPPSRDDSLVSHRVFRGRTREQFGKLAMKVIVVNSNERSTRSEHPENLSEPTLGTGPKEVSEPRVDHIHGCIREGKMLS